MSFKPEPDPHHHHHSTLTSFLGIDVSMTKHAVVSIVGAGGKTTFMYTLANELLGLRMKCVCATTTHIFKPDSDDRQRYTVHIVNSLDEFIQECKSIDLEFKNLFDEPPSNVPDPHDGVNDATQSNITNIHLFGTSIELENKIKGIPPEWIDKLSTDDDMLELIWVIEADGSRQLPLKAPKENEPVVPESTSHFVAVVGLSCLGQPIDEQHVCRSAKVKSLCFGAKVVDEVCLASVCSDEKNGLLKGSVKRHGPEPHTTFCCTCNKLPLVLHPPSPPISDLLSVSNSKTSSLSNPCVSQNRFVLLNQLNAMDNGRWNAVFRCMYDIINGPGPHFVDRVAVGSLSNLRQ